MTKEELLKKITDKLGKTSLSERTLNTYAENVLKMISNDEQVSDDFLANHVSILKSLDGQLSHDITSGIDDWKKENKVETTPPTKTPPTPEDGTTKAILETLEQLKKDNAELKSRYENEQKSRDQKHYREKLAKAMEAKGAKNNYILNQTINRKEYDTTKSVEDVVEEALKEYDTNYQSCFGEGATPRDTNNGSGSGNGDNKFLDNFFAQKASEGKFPEVKN